MQNKNLTSDKYDAITSDYAGKWVIWCDGDVIYADTSIDVVLKEYKRLMKIGSGQEYTIELIDDGEGSFYGVKIST